MGLIVLLSGLSVQIMIFIMIGITGIGVIMSLFIPPISYRILKLVSCCNKVEHDTNVINVTTVPNVAIVTVTVPVSFFGMLRDVFTWRY